MATATAKQTPATPNKETQMATDTKINTETGKVAFDTSKLSVQEMLALAEKLQKDAAAAGQKEFDSTMNFLDEKLAKMGRTKTDAVTALLLLMTEEERAAFKRTSGGGSNGTRKPRAPRGSKPAREYKDKDSTGARPEAGKTYALPSDPKKTWKKAESGLGAVNKEFLAAVQGGAKWADMLKK